MPAENTTDSGRNTLPPADVLGRLAVSESGFVFDPSTGHNFTVNETGVALLRLMQKGLRLDQLLAALAEEYDGEPREMERDVLEFTGALRDHVGV